MEEILSHSLIDTGEVKLNVTQAGPAEGKLVLLLHGFPDFWYGWRQQLAPLAQAGFHVVVPDQRGYNLSDKPKEVPAYQIERLAKDVVGLLDALGAKEACIAGHDWGAAVAWETAIRFPGRVEKLAILNVPHPDVMQRYLRGSWGQVRKSWYIFFFQLPWLPEALLRRRGYGNLMQLLKRSGKAGTFDERDLPAYLQAWSQPGALTAMINWYRAVLRGGGTRFASAEKAGARRVKPPTLILWGKQDVALSSEMVQPSLELCDQGQLVFFEKATHWVQLDEAGAVTHHLREYFEDEG